LSRRRPRATCTNAVVGADFARTGWARQASKCRSQAGPRSPLVATSRAGRHRSNTMSMRWSLLVPIVCVLALVRAAHAAPDAAASVGEAGDETAEPADPDAERELAADFAGISPTIDTDAVDQELAARAP